MLGIIPEVIKEFEKSDVVEVSEPPFGGLYYLDEDQKKKVTEIEQTYSCLVYLVVRSFMEFGKMDSYLFVSDYKEEWEDECEDIKNGAVLTYTHNYDAPWCSEFGSIGVKGIGGSLIRVW